MGARRDNKRGKSERANSPSHSRDFDPSRALIAALLGGPDWHLHVITIGAREERKLGME